MLVSWSRLTQLLHYDPRTGIFRWRTKHYKYHAGEIAGHGGGVNPYIRIGVDGRSYYAQVLAYFYMKRRWPTKKTDHRNGNKHDNRWRNLRLASDLENMGNMPKHRRNTTGFKGVSFRRGCFRAKIARTDIGTFKDALSAAKAYDAAARKKFGAFAKTNF